MYVKFASSYQSYLFALLFILTCIFTLFYVHICSLWLCILCQFYANYHKTISSSVIFRVLFALACSALFMLNDINTLHLGTHSFTSAFLANVMKTMLL